MRKRISGLYDAASAYFEHISSPIPDAPDDLEVWEGMKEALSHSFRVLRTIYNPDAGQPLITASEVQLQLDISQEDPSWAAMAQALALANMASLWEIMVENPTRDLQFLHLLESTFPDFYIPLGPQGYITDKDPILHQIMEIRTQHLFLRLRLLQTESPHPFNPHKEVLKIFCQDHVDVNELQEAMQNNVDRLDFKEVVGMAEEDWSWVAKYMTNRISALCKELPNEEVRDVTAPLESLEDTFSFDNFLDAFQNYTRDWFAEISTSLTTQAHPGRPFSQADTSSQIQSQLEAEATRAPRYVVVTLPLSATN